MADLSTHYSGLAQKKQWGWINSPHYLDFWSERIATLLAICPDDTLLDLGGADGAVSASAGSRAGLRNRVLCVDPSQALLDNANPDKVETVCADACDYLAERETCSIDTALLKGMIHHIPANKRPALAKNLYRTLTDGGRMMLITMPAQIPYPMLPEVAEFFTQTQINVDDILDWLPAAGFVVAHLKVAYDVEMSKADYSRFLETRPISEFRVLSDEQLQTSLAKFATTLPETIKTQDWMHVPVGLKIEDNSPRTSIKASSIHGLGLFAEKDFGTGDIVMTLDGSTVPESEIDFDNKRADWNALDNGLFLLRHRPTKHSLINHAKAPNTITNLQGRVLLAREPIACGSEITRDYTQEPLPAKLCAQIRDFS